MLVRRDTVAFDKPVRLLIVSAPQEPEVSAMLLAGARAMAARTAAEDGDLEGEQCYVVLRRRIETEKRFRREIGRAHV